MSIDNCFGYFLGIGLVWFVAWWANPNLSHGTVWFVAAIVGFILGDTAEIRFKLRDWESRWKNTFYGQS